MKRSIRTGANRPIQQVPAPPRWRPCNSITTKLVDLIADCCGKWSKVNGTGKQGETLMSRSALSTWLVPPTCMSDSPRPINCGTTTRVAERQYALPSALAFWLVRSRRHRRRPWCFGGGVARPGFERLLAAICSGSRWAPSFPSRHAPARIGRDWHTLLEFCAHLWAASSSTKKVSTIHAAPTTGCCFA